MRQLIPTRFVARFFWPMVLLLGCFPLQAELPYSSRYFKDQQTRQVVTDVMRVLGDFREGKVYLSERQAVEMALNHNLEINVERHVPLRKRWVVEQNRAVYDPLNTLSLNWDRATTPTSSILQGATRLTDVFTTLHYDYRQSFSNGSSFEVRFDGTRNRTTNFFASLVPAIDTRFELLFRQNLLPGFGRILPDYQIEISRNDVSISEQEFRRGVTEIVVQVQNRYWELQFALEDIRVKEKSLELSNTALEENRVRVEAGTSAALEVVQSEAEAALRREELIRARFNYRRIQDQLIRLITSYDDLRDFPGEIVPSDVIFAPPPVSDSWERLKSIATQERSELKQTELEIKNGNLNLERSRRRLRPSLDLVAGYQQFGLGGRQVVRDFSQGFLDPPVLEIVPGGLGDSLSQLFSSDFYGYLLGFSLQVPVFNTEARAANARAQLSLSQAEMQRKNLLQAISLEIRDALHQIEMNEARVAAAGEAVRFAQDRLASEQVRFEVGRGKTRELIEAQRDLVRAQSVSLRAKVDLIQGHNLLDRALGRTLQVHRIQLSEVLTRNVRGTNR